MKYVLKARWQEYVHSQLIAEKKRSLKWWKHVNKLLVLYMSMLMHMYAQTYFLHGGNKDIELN